MFRIVERDDGSTAIFDQTTGSLLKIIPPPPKLTQPLQHAASSSTVYNNGHSNLLLRPHINSRPYPRSPPSLMNMNSIMNQTSNVSAVCRSSSIENLVCDVQPGEFVTTIIIEDSNQSSSTNNTQQSNSNHFSLMNDGKRTRPYRPPNYSHLFSEDHYIQDGVPIPAAVTIEKDMSEDFDEDQEVGGTEQEDGDMVMMMTPTNINAVSRQQQQQLQDMFNYWRPPPPPPLNGIQNVSTTPTLSDGQSQDSKSLMTRKPEHHFVIVYKQSKKAKIVQNGYHDSNRDRSDVDNGPEEVLQNLGLTRRRIPRLPSVNGVKPRSLSVDTTVSSTLTTNKEQAAVHPVRMRLLPSSTLDKICSSQDRHLGVSITKQYFRSGGESPIENNTIDRREPELESMDELTFTKYLNLIPSSTMDRIPIDELNHSWPLRYHNRTPGPTVMTMRYHPYKHKSSKHTVNNSNNMTLRSSSALTTSSKTNSLLVVEKLHANSCHLVMKPTEAVLNNFPTSRLGLLRKSNSSPAITTTLTSTTVNGQNTSPTTKTLKSYRYILDRELMIPEVQPPLTQNGLVITRNQTLPSLSLSSEHRKLLLKRFINKYMLKPAQYYRPGIEMSSTLGRRLIESYGDAFLSIRSSLEMRRLIRSYERYCSTNLNHFRQFLQSIKSPFNSKIKIDFNLPSPIKTNCLTSRLLRSQNLINPSSNAWGLKSYHIYSFSKQERLEKKLTIESGGLDWKGRLLAKHCDEGVVIEVEKLNKCLLCGKQFDLTMKHSCQGNCKEDEISNKKYDQDEVDDDEEYEEEKDEVENEPEQDQTNLSWLEGVVKDYVIGDEEEEDPDLLDSEHIEEPVKTMNENEEGHDRNIDKENEYNNTLEDGFVNEEQVEQDEEVGTGQQENQSQGGIVDVSVVTEPNEQFDSGHEIEIEAEHEEIESDFEEELVLIGGTTVKGNPSHSEVVVEEELEESIPSPSQCMCKAVSPI